MKRKAKPPSIVVIVAPNGAAVAVCHGDSPVIVVLPVDRPRFGSRLTRRLVELGRSSLGPLLQLAARFGPALGQWLLDHWRINL